MTCCTPRPAARRCGSPPMPRPTSIILDLGLPDMDGKEVLRRRAQFTQAPILILSARDREAEKIAALDLGADDYVEKPFAIGELLARLRAALRHAKGAAAGKTRIEVDGLVIDSREAPRHPRRRADQADAARIRPAVRARAQRRARDDPQPDPDRRLGPGAQGRHAISACVRRPVARQDRDATPRRRRSSAPKPGSAIASWTSIE